MRPIDFCHPYDLRLPVPRAFPARYRSLSLRGCLVDSRRSTRLDRRTGRFTTPEDRFGTFAIE